MARTYAICSPAEAQAYLEHPVLGPRLSECASALAGLSGLSAQEVLGSIDAIKLRSSMTLFARLAPEGSLFQRILDDYFGGAGDPATEAWLARHQRPRDPPARPR